VIGVVAATPDLPIVEEFFELFKIPWERAVPSKKYPIVLSSTDNIEPFDADRILIYGSREHPVDRAAGAVVRPARGTIDWVGSSSPGFPIYGSLATFGPPGGDHDLESSGRPVDYRCRLGPRHVWRVGYDLFHEIRHLLSHGQPAAHAATPTLDLHIAVLRHLLVRSGLTVVEIAPRPYGYDFIACLTHDVDFYGIRRHVFDRTLAGFVARASLGTLGDVLRGRRPVMEAVRNWAALSTLPFVLLKLAEDPWRPFDDYARVEEGHKSTFFLVPFRNRPGMAPDGSVNAARAVAYEAAELRSEVSQARARGSEIAVHGIDAWRDAEAGRAELRRVTGLTGEKSAGVRMHWLYFSADSPRLLEASGFDYDSTWGYNDQVGYRAGTSQVFRLPGTDRFMELPMSIMDSALFFGGRMNLDCAEAAVICGRIVANARRFGGTVVVNWHDRSLAPERQWGRFYEDLRAEIGRNGRAWFARAGETVEWFRWRRSLRFTSETGPTLLTIDRSPAPPGMPPALVQIHRPASTAPGPAEEIRFDGDAPLALNI
jgi:hypothetical protein